MNHINLLSIQQQREKLKDLTLESPRKFRILYLGHFGNGDTDIVACLLRSLRNLGHSVLHINPFIHHKYLLIKKPKYVSGHGPVLIDLASLKLLLKKFKPQVIVCCAGGLCFSERDSQELKSQGILLVGLTLSDPDVQSSMINHVNYFDYHTTNSEVALKCYNEAGINNTFLLPFGIDRSYVSAEVEHSSEYEADVICLGHATNRPERQELMGYLARKFKVKVYGTGWQLPNAKTVRGYEMLQASRYGRIHINFPQTRAGYTNVKCGVFESVASGAVLCTTEFEEMKKYFEYGSEVIGFNNKEELSRQINDLLSNEVQYESVRRRGFHKLINYHLYEHRWLNLFSKIEQDVFEKSRIITQERAKVLRKSLDKNYSFCKKVIISGFYGAKNTGDELILQSISEGVTKRYPHIQFFVASSGPQRVESVHALQSFGKSNLAVVDREISSASATILGGGGLWHDYTFHRSGGMLSLFGDTQMSLAGYGRLPLLGCIYDLPFYVFGIGVGPLSNPDAQKFLKFLIKQTQVVSVRDKNTLEFLKQVLECKDEIEYFPDPVFALDITECLIPAPVKEIMGNKPILGVNLRYWQNSKIPQSTWKNLAQALGQITKQHNCILLGIPMQGGKNNDEALLSQVFEMIDSPQPKIVLNWTDNFAELFGTLKACQGLVSMRLHCCLLAHRLGVPTVGLAYDPKVRSHFQELGIEDFSVALDFSVPILVDKIKQILSLEGHHLPQSVKTRVQQIESQAREGIKTLGSRLNSVVTVKNTVKVLNQITKDSAPNKKVSKPKVIESKVSKPKVIESKVSKPKVIESKVSKPKVIESKVSKLVEKDLSYLEFASKEKPNVLSSNWYTSKKDPKFQLIVLSKESIKISLNLTEPNDRRYVGTSDVAFNKHPKKFPDWEIKSFQEYYVYLKTNFISGNITGILWLIEYSETDRLRRTSTNIKRGETKLRVMTYSNVKYFRITIGLAGSGIWEVGKPTIYEVSN